MDEAVIKYYRQLLRAGFEYAGSIDSPSILLESIGDGRVCGAGDYLRMFVNVSNGRIDDIKYLCRCDPTANVAIEILCALLKGKRLDEVEAMTEDSFFQALGSRSDSLREKAKGLLELLNRELAGYRTKMSQTDLR